jgi:phosphoserine phosphatase RsbU/P
MAGEAYSSSIAQWEKGAAESCDRPRVLIAEDQDDVVVALGLLLKSNDYEVSFVKSPRAAVEALRRRIFDAVLLDLNYSRDTTSGNEGLELLSQVQALDNSVAIVVMTAWGTIELAVNAMSRGACGFVQKPWDNAQLLQVLNEQIKRSRELRATRLREQIEQLEAMQIQRALFPGPIASGDGLSIMGSTQAARTVGGDYYDVIRIGQHRWALCIADVMGKGLGAALLMSNLQAAVHTLASEVPEPRELCNRVNQVISANSVPGRFISFFYCVLDVNDGRIRYSNAGHYWPILARSDGRCQRLATEDVVLGALRQWNYHQQEEELRSGDRLVLFTDGITECSDAQGLEFGEDKLLGLISKNVALSAESLKDLILQSASIHCGGLFTDDASLIVAAVDR